ncbi:esterase-like activity of phytase family protein [Phenylobacterium sp.]|uniref:esterase-like activity of phytase family protein n=1 Tax=Phenylobacterium sp. TaxID=1871053 RepID=UPI003983463D
MPPPEVTPLRWRDPPLGEIAFPAGVLRLTLGVGSGLSRRPGDPPGRFWGLGDRGPNLKIADAISNYGLDHLEPLRGLDGAKVLPAPEIGPTLAELQIVGDRVELLRTLRLSTPDGALVSGRALPGSRQADMEPTFDAAGLPLATDPAGADTEAVAALADGSFWVAEEYGPSLMQVDGQGVVRRRWTPQGLNLPGVQAILPARAAERRMNRGLEGLAASPNGRWLYAGFQSALDRPGEDRRAALIWKLDAATGGLAGEFSYPFDPPKSFTADAAAGRVDAGDLKICELAWVGPDRLLVLERISRSARIYRIDLATGRPLIKTLLFSTDREGGIAADLEGMAVMSDCELVLATDNDFGVEAAETRFYRLVFDRPLAG